jgi:hypothetical protein
LIVEVRHGQTKMNEYNNNNNNNNNKLVEWCNTTQTEKCCRLCVGNIMRLYNECLFFDLASSWTLKMDVYLYIYHNHYDDQCIVLQLYIGNNWCRG